MWNKREIERGTRERERKGRKELVLRGPDPATPFTYRTCNNLEKVFNNGNPPKNCNREEEPPRGKKAKPPLLGRGTIEETFNVVSLGRMKNERYSHGKFHYCLFHLRNLYL